MVSRARLFLTSILAVAVVAVTGDSLAAPATATKSKPADDDNKWSWSELLPVSFQKNPRLSMTIITEVTKAGEAVTPATPEKPVYYLMTDGKRVEEGDVVAGERAPQHHVLVRSLQSALAVNGYLPATAEHAPTIAIHYMWGSFNKLAGFDLTVPGATEEEPEMTIEDDGSNLFTNDPAVRRNQMLRASIIGGAKFARELAAALREGPSGLMMFRNRDHRNDWLVDEVAHSNRYFLIATAFDLKGAESRARIPLWLTKISTDSTGLSMDESMLALVGNAAPHFGRAMPEAVVLRARLKQGRVEIGTATVQEYLDRPPDRKAPAAPTPPAPSTPAKKGQP